MQGFRDGTITSLCEKGADADEGRHRLTFYSTRRRLRLIVDAAGFTIPAGRQLLEGWPDGADTLVIMLDGKCSFQSLDPVGVSIWWGAYVGMAEQIILCGPLAEVGSQIVATRAQARAAHGWIMDIYILRRSYIDYITLLISFLPAGGAHSIFTCDKRVISRD